MQTGKVILTGAGGGIGSRLGKMLLESGHEVLGLDVKPPEDRSVPWHYTDLANRDSVMRALEGASAVIHLGEIPNVHGPYAPDEVFARNTRIASTVFQAAAYLGVGNVVYASSAQVYGCWGPSRVPPIRLLLDEDHPVQPQNAYAMSKVANEGYLKMVAEQTPGFSATALRFPGVTAVWWPWQVFVERLHAHLDERDGLASYVHLEDLCEAFIMALDSPQAGTRVFNVLADDVANLTPIQDYVAAIWPDLEVPEGHPEDGNWASAERIKRDLGWKPKFSVRQAHAELAKV